MTGRKQEHPTIQTPTMKKGINCWCEESRPREKLLRFGAEHLEVPELMAILIGSGSTDQDAVSLMKQIYHSYGNNLSALSHITFEELTAFKGIGQAKAAVFFLIVVVISLIQLHFTRSKEVQQ